MKRFLMACALALCGVAAQAQTTVEYLHTDALGSIVAVTDASAQVIERREYAPFGEQLQPTVPAGLGYTGHVEDRLTGLTYMQQRYYDPAIGRFLSVDPVGPLDNPINHFGRYHYANNNPYKYTDPDGRLPILIPIAIVAWRAYSAYDTVTTAADNISTVADSRASTGDRMIAGAELLGSAIGGKAGRTVVSGAAKAVRGADNAGDVAKTSRRPTTAQREAALERSRDENGVERCTYCGVELDRAPGKPNSAEIDHHDAWSRGGQTVDENLNAACRSCNREAGAKTKGVEWIPPKDRK